MKRNRPSVRPSFGSSFSTPRLSQTALAVIAALAAPGAYALPTGGQVVGGQASISQPNAQTVQVNQSTQRAALNWTSFSIGGSESVLFQQPSASSIALNSVTGSNPSQIFGRLSANGQIFLVNPNGILFAPGSSVDVGGLAASTLKMSVDDFMSGRYVFSRDGAAGSVVNQGTINAPGGYVALMGPNVSNEGVIAARRGSVALAAGDRVTLDMIGDGLISVRVDQAALDASILNKGTIEADGGNVLLTARSANALLDTVINSEGVIRANTLVERGGSIYLDGGSAGVTSVTGTLSAAGLGAGEKGGSVTLLGDKVGLFGTALIDASGVAGGGVVHVGGSQQGLGPLPNSNMVYTGPDTRITTSANTNGNGGTIILYANESARLYGALEARGGAAGGDGGFIETSGKKFLDIGRTPDAGAPNGKGGEWLIDPGNITISNGGNCSNVTNSCSDTNGTWNMTNVSTANIPDNLIEAALNNDTNVTISTATGSGGTGVVSIADGADLARTDGNNPVSLTINADAGISFAGNNTIFSGGNDPALNVILNAGGNITGLPAVTTLRGGTLTLNATGNVTQVGVIAGNTSLVKQGAGILTLDQANTYSGTTNISAGTVVVTNNAGLGGTGGDTSVASNATLDIRAAVGAEGVSMNGGALTTSTGNGSLSGVLTLGANTTVDVAGNLTLSGQITGAFALTKEGSGTLIVSDTGNNYSGGTNINNGTFRLGASNVLANAGAVTLANVSGAIFDVNGNTETIGTLSGGGTSGGSITLGAGTLTVTQGANATFDGVISGSGGSLTKQGTATLTLSNANTNSGTFTISNGTLSVTNAAALHANSSVVVNGGTLDINGVTLNNVTSFNITSTGAGGVGALTGTGSAQYAGPITLVGNAAIGANANSTLTLSGVIGGSNANFGVSKVGSGTLVFTVANTYEGTTNVSAGILSVNNAAALHANSSLVVSGGTFDINGVTLNNVSSFSVSGAGAGNVGAVTGTGTAGYTGPITLAANATFGGAGTLTLNGNISGAFALTKEGNGTLVLGGANGYSAGTFINNGTLRLGSGGVLADAGGVTLANASGVLLDVNGQTETIGTLSGGGTSGGNISLGAGTLTVTQAANGTFSGVISGSAAAGNLTKNGNATLTLSNANSYEGTTLVNCGTLSVNNPGALHVNSTLTLNGGTLDINNVTLNTLLAGVSIQGNGTGAGAITGTGINAAYNGNITLSGDAAIGGEGTLTLGGIVGSGLSVYGVEKIGNGTLVLSGLNAYLGNTTVSAGTLSVANNAAIPNTLLTLISGATLDINNVTMNTLTLGISANGTGASGNGAITGTGPNAGYVGPITLAGDTTFGGEGTLTLNGTINGTFVLTKTGNGTLVLGGSTNAFGDTVINNGILSITNGAAIPTSSNLTINAGGTLDINGVILNTINGTFSANGAGFGNVGAVIGTGTAEYDGPITLAANTTFGGTGTLTLKGTISGAASLTKEGSGTLVLGATGNNYTGATLVNNGTLKLGASAVIPNLSALTVNGTLDLNAFNETVGSLAGSGVVTMGVAGFSRLTVGANDLSTEYSGIIQNGAGTVALTKQGNGTLRLSGNNTQTGFTSVTNGILEANHSFALGMGNVGLSGGTLAINNVTLSGVSGIDVSNGSGFQSNGAITGSGSNAAYSGQIWTDLLSGGTLTIGVSAGSQLVIGGSICSFLCPSLTGESVSKIGTGTLVFSNANFYSGNTMVNAGTLRVTHNAALHTSSGLIVANGATVELSDVNLNTLSNGFQVNGTGAGVNGAVIGTGTSSYGGPITLAGNTMVGGAGTLTLAGTIGQNVGPFSLTKEGAGTLVLASGTTNTYTGGTVVNNGTLRLGANGTAIGSILLQDVSGVLLDVPNTTTASIGTLEGGGTSGGNLALGVNSTLTVNQGANTTFSGALIGDATSNLILNATAGILTLDGNSSAYSGFLTIGAGTLSVTATDALGTGIKVAVNGGTLDINDVTLNTLAQLNLNGTGNAGVGALTGTGANAAYNGNITLTGATTVGGNGSLSLNGTISESGGSFGLTKQGNGTLVLAGNNTYTGTTTVSGGALTLMGGAAIADTGAVDVQTGTLLVAATETIGRLIGANGTTVTLDASLTFGDATNTTVASTIGGAGGLTKQGSSTVTLSGVNTYAGVTAVNVGTLAVSNASGLGSTANGTTVANGAMLDLQNVTVGAEVLTLNGTLAASMGTSSLAGAIMLGANGTVDVGGAQLALSGDVTETGGPFGLAKQGIGMLALSGNNTYTGTTTVAAGTLVLSGGAAIVNTGVVDLQVGTLQVSTAETIGRLIGAPGTTLTLDAGLTFGDATDSAVGSTIGGAAGLTKQGASTVTLSGTNTYGGVTAVNAGTLAVTNASGLGSIANGTTVANGATLQINGVAIPAESVSVAGTGVAGNAIDWTGNASLAGPVMLTGNTAIGGTGNMAFSGAVNGGFGLTVNSGGVTTFSALVGGTTPLASLTTDAAGTTVIGGAVTTGAQFYGDPVGISGGFSASAFTAAQGAGLGGNTTISAATVTFGGAVDGASTLTVNSSGTTTFSSTVGAATPLISLTTDAGGTTILKNVTTAGAQTYGDNVTMNSVYNTGGGHFSVGGTTTVASNSTVNTGSGNATFSGLVQGPGSLTVNSSGATSFASLSGGTTLGGITTDQPGTVLLPSTVTTNGDQKFLDNASTAGSITFTTSGGLVQVGENQNPSLPNTAIILPGKLTVTSSGGSVKILTTSTLDVASVNAGTGTVELRTTQDFVNLDFPSGGALSPVNVFGSQLTLGMGKFPPDAATSAELNQLGLFNLASNTTALNIISTLGGERLIFFTSASSGLSPTVNAPANIGILVNDVQLNTAFSGNVILRSVVSSAQRAAVAASTEEAKKSFGTDSVLQQIDFGFVGDVGTTPPMDHRITDVGISVPDCFGDSRDSQPCK